MKSKTINELFFIAILVMLLSGVVFLCDSPANGQENQTIPELEKWEKAWFKKSEEKVMINDKYQSGIVRRWFLDPVRKLGLGYTMSVFYKDGSEYLYGKAWLVRTPEVHEALKLEDETWIVAKTKSLTPSAPVELMRSLSKIYERQTKKPIKQLFTVLKNDETNQILASRYIYFNKNSANEPDPVEPEK